MSESQSSESEKPERWLPAFFAHLTASTLGAAVVGFVAAFLLAGLTAAFTKNTSGGNWVDHLADQRIFTAAAEPYFVFPVLIGFALGVLSYRYSRSSSAGFGYCPLSYSSGTCLPGRMVASVLIGRMCGTTILAHIVGVRSVSMSYSSLCRSTLHWPTLWAG
jgi:hypothetical protein